MNNEEKLHKALSEMPVNFTTDQFNRKCHTHGLDEILEKKATRGFLSIHCKEMSRRRWFKNELVNADQLELPIEEKEMTDKELIANLEKRVKELEAIAQPEPLKPEAYQRPKPERGEEYYYIGNDGFIYSLVWNNDDVDEYQYRSGNINKTKEEAELRRDKQLLTQELKDFAEGGEWIDRAKQYEIKVNAQTAGMAIIHIVEFAKHKSINGIYFKSEQEANEAIRKFGDRLNILFN
jgi:hypothetical protein